MILDGFCNALSNESFDICENTFAKDFNCEEAYSTIFATISSKQFFDIAIIDKGLPGFEEKSISSGSDLAVLLREKMPNCKLLRLRHIQK